MVACSGQSTGTAGYLDEVAALTTKMTTDSVATLQQSAAPTHLQIEVIVALRRDALEKISALDPTEEVQPEHLALVTSLRQLVDAGEAFLTETAGLDPTAFQDAIDASVEIDALAAAVHEACAAMELRAGALEHPITMGC